MRDLHSPRSDLLRDVTADGGGVTDNGFEVASGWSEDAAVSVEPNPETLHQATPDEGGKHLIRMGVEVRRPLVKGEGLFGCWKRCGWSITGGSFQCQEIFGISVLPLDDVSPACIGDIYGDRSPATSYYRISMHRTSDSPFILPRQIQVIINDHNIAHRK